MERETIEKKDAYMIGDSNALHISSLIATEMRCWEWGAASG